MMNEKTFFQFWEKCDILFIQSHLLEKVYLCIVDSKSVELELLVLALLLLLFTVHLLHHVVLQREDIRLIKMK